MVPSIMRNKPSDLSLTVVATSKRSTSTQGSAVSNEVPIKPVIDRSTVLRMIQPGNPELIPYCEEHGHAEKVFGYIGSKRGIGILCTYCDALYTRKPTSQEQDALNRLMDL